MQVALEIGSAGLKGRGLFARSHIFAGEKITDFTGFTLRTHELTDDLLALQIDHDLWLCSRGGEIDDCINHSCDPNGGFTTGAAVLYALRDIAAGEEITFDYSTSISEIGWRLECACGAATCRKTVLPWRELPESLRSRLRPTALLYLRASSAQENFTA